jgi:ferritin-like metal-binding protein YciE
MLGVGLTLENLHDVLVMQLKDLYSAEDQLITALPKMAEAAHSPELRMAFQNHLQETRQHKQRLEQVFRLLGCEPEAETCDAMKSMITEGDDVCQADGDPEVKDAAIIAAAQRVEHYEIAAYGCARTFAHRLGHQEAGRLLQETLDEEGNADKLLTHIAETAVNREAAHA